MPQSFGYTAGLNLENVLIIGRKLCCLLMLRFALYLAFLFVVLVTSTFHFQACQRRTFPAECQDLDEGFQSTSAVCKMALIGIDFRAPLREVKKVQFGILSPDEI